jgi:hypothetical protein
MIPGLILPGQNSVLDLSLTVAEEMAALNHLCNFRGHHALPGSVVVLDSFQDITRENMQQTLIEIVQLFDPAALHQVPIQTSQIGGHLHVVNGVNQIGAFVPQRIDVDSQILSKQLAKRLEDAAFQSRVILLRE